ncbi:hypothetical protein FHR29_000034 [Sphingobacterium sp. JUb56]|nr:hypothetical protein [Sphingobacterium sp. JUb56]
MMRPSFWLAVQRYTCGLQNEYGQWNTISDFNLIKKIIILQKNWIIKVFSFLCKNTKENTFIMNNLGQININILINATVVVIVIICSKWEVNTL